MKEQAIAKLQAEMDKQQNAYVQIVGKCLIDFLNLNPAEAKKILVDKKTISGSIEAMRAEASKVKVNNCAVLDSDQIIEIVLKYFGLKGAVPVPQPHSSLNVVASPKEDVVAPEANIEAASRKKFEASLDEFL